jgi:gliding motility-associated-like protein
MGDGKPAFDKLDNTPFLYEYATPGNYTVKLVAHSDKGCVSVLFQLVVNVSVLPVNSFVLPENCLSDGPAVFVNNSKNVDGTTNNLTYLWDFGDPASGALNSSTDPNGSHKYNLAGTYPVTLTLTNSNGCVVILKQDFVVKPLPTADFLMSAEACEDTNISFTDKSVSNVSNLSVKYWEWDFGDGTTSTVPNPTHIYRSFGNLTVKLTVKTETGCISDVITKNILIHPKVVSKFRTNETTCVNTKISFEDQSTVALGSIVKWVWDMGDGKAPLDRFNNTSFLYEYDTPGAYTVKLITHSDKGCVSVPFELVVNVSVLPTNDFYLPDVCLSDGPAVFTNFSKDVDGTTTNLTYLWNFGDPGSGVLNSSTAKDGSHKYNAAGNYNVSLTITNANGCVVKLEKVFTVNGIFPVAGFDVLNSTSLCSNKNISLVNTSTVDFGTVTKIEWFLDGVKHSEDINPTPNKVYDFVYPQFTSPLTKNLTVKMVVYSGGTCSNEITKNLTLLAIPVVNFKTVTPICLVDGTAFFENLSRDVDGTTTNLTYLWDFGDPVSGALNTSTTKDGVHKYAMAGNYNISLTITNANGCTVNLVQAIQVDGAIPVPGFDVVNASNLCSNTNISLVNTSAVAFGDISKIEWYLDGVKHSEDTNPVLNKVYDFVYPKFTSPLTKNLTVKMVVYSGLICSDEITKNLTLLASPEINFDPLTSVCLNNPAFQLGATEIGGLVGVGVYSGVGVSNSGLFNPQIAGVGVHEITYTFTAANGCLASKTQSIEVYPLPIIDAGNDFFLLVGGQKKIDAKADGLGLTYKWTPSTGLDKDDILTPIASPELDITYTLTVTSALGCVVVDQVFVKVLQNIDAPNSFTPNGDGINDVWNIKYLDSYPNTSVEIFNRNGERVFFSRGYAVPFDGNYRNQALPVGTYYYIITPNSGRKSVTGSLTIIR